jgi:hypothetical protein
MRVFASRGFMTHILCVTENSEEILIPIVGTTFKRSSPNRIIATFKNQTYFLHMNFNDLRRLISPLKQPTYNYEDEVEFK